MSKKVVSNKISSCDIKRGQRLTCFLTDEEMLFIENYLRKNGVSNRSRWMRETLISFILRDLDDNYPLLFDEHEMRR